MFSYDWKGLMEQWNRELLASRALVHELEYRSYRSDAYKGRYTEEVLKSGWLGYPGATDEQITRTEARLGVALPPDYRQFLAFTNGWRLLTHFIPGLWPVKDLEWTRVTDPDLIEIWEDEELTQGLEYIMHESKYLRSTLRISDQEYAGTAILLLNPGVVTGHGEWEAWFFAHWSPEDRCSSFWELMNNLHESFLQVEGSDNTQAMEQ